MTVAVLGVSANDPRLFAVLAATDILAEVAVAAALIAGAGFQVGP